MSDELSHSAFTLLPGPEDDITSLKFRQGDRATLCCTAWDKTARLYDVDQKTQTLCATLGSPILDCAFLSGQPSRLFCGCIDGKLMELDLNEESTRIIGQQEAGIKAVLQAGPACLITGSWDRTIAQWDVRESGGQPCIRIPVPGRVYSLSHEGTKLLAGFSERIIHLFDLRKLGTPFQRRESSLKGATRCVRLFPGGEGFATSSVDGRIAIDFLGDRRAQSYAFKCHRETARSTEGVVTTTHPVHALHFLSPTILLSGGGDGLVNTWDINGRCRLGQSEKMHTSISALAGTDDSSLLAIGVSYCYEHGEPKETTKAKLLVRLL